MPQFHHIGLIVQTEMPGETYYETLKVWATSADDDPHRVEWIRFGPDGPLADTPVAKEPHVCFTVDDLDSEIQGKDMVVAPLQVVEGLRIAYFRVNGLLFEYLEAK